MLTVRRVRASPDGLSPRRCHPEGRERRHQAVTDPCEVAFRWPECSEPDRHRCQEMGELLSRLLAQIQEGKHRNGIPVQIRARREERALARPPLRQADHLLPRAEDLARAPAGETDQFPEIPGHGAAGVDRQARHPQSNQGVRPPRADPFRRGRDVVVPERVVTRDPAIEPERVVGGDIDRPSPSSATSQLDASPASCVRVDDLSGLGAAQDQRRHGDRADDRQALRLAAELLDVKE